MVWTTFVDHLVLPVSTILHLCVVACMCYYEGKCGQQLSVHTPEISSVQNTVIDTTRYTDKVNIDI